MRRYPIVLLLALLVTLLAAACSGGGPAGDPAPVAPAPTPTPPGGPTLTAVTPVEGRLQGGTPVRIEGRGFLDEEPVWVRVGGRVLEVFASDDGVLEVYTP